MSSPESFEQLPASDAFPQDLPSANYWRSRQNATVLNDVVGYGAELFLRGLSIGEVRTAWEGAVSADEMFDRLVDLERQHSDELILLADTQKQIRI